MLRVKPVRYGCCNVGEETNEGGWGKGEKLLAEGGMIAYEM